MTIYEVRVENPYSDCEQPVSDRFPAVFFANKSDAEAYMDKMVKDREVNRDISPGLFDEDEDFKPRYATRSDYVETEVKSSMWLIGQQSKMESTEFYRLLAIVETNELVDTLNDYDAILVAKSYGENLWFLREHKLN